MVKQIKALSIVQSKIVDREQLDRILNIWKFKGNRLVFTNGCFDILHLGHVDYLSKASDLGTKLMVGVNSDDSVKRLNKGSNRPLQTEKSRATIIASLHFVDLVVVFDEDTPYELISSVKPDVLVKGSDYKVEDIVGSDLVLNNGGEVKTIDFLEGHSTTSIVNKAKL